MRVRSPLIRLLASGGTALLWLEAAGSVAAHGPAPAEAPSVGSLPADTRLDGFANQSAKLTISPGPLRRIQNERDFVFDTLLDSSQLVPGVLAADKERNVTLYHSAVTKAQAQRGELLYALKHAFNGALTPMVQCLLNSGEISHRELANLETLIRAKKKQAKS
jgi:hypothetical protein